MKVEKKITFNLSFAFEALVFRWSLQELRVERRGPQHSREGFKENEYIYKTMVRFHGKT